MMRFGPFFLAVLASGCGPSAEAAPQTAQVVVDAGKRSGVIRPLHGVNGGPISYGGMADTTEHFRAAAIPQVRLHDCQWPTPAVVDIHTIFPDFRDDPEDPASYSFARTDDYLQSVLHAGATIYYRLGESIEHTRRKYHTHPPADMEKWAAVCLGIIRHYNEGWAAGFQHGIQYWEVWNEPEVRPQMWSGTDEDYYRLYGTTVRAIKARFPHLKVGGPGAGNVGELKNGRLEPAPLVAGLLRRCREESLPLDFFSWHRYTDDPAELAQLASAVREWLDQSGFPHTESHLNEWNYLPGRDWSVFVPGKPAGWERWYAAMDSGEAAAFIAGALIHLQNAPIDAACLYSAETHGFGIFSRFGEPRRPYYALKAFSRLLDTPVRVHAQSSAPSVLHVLAGMHRHRPALNLLVAHDRGAATELELRVAALPWKGQTRCEIIEVSSRDTWAPKPPREVAEGDITMRDRTQPGTTRLYQFSPSEAAPREPFRQ
jgi:hypothetical protein